MHCTVPQIIYTPEDLFKGVTGYVMGTGLLLSGGENSRAFGVGGHNQMRLHYEITRVDATDMTFFIEDKPLDEANVGGSNFGRGKFGDVDPSTGIATYRNLQYLIPDLATAANVNGHLDIPINCLGQLHIGAISGTAASTDRVLMWITLGVV